jgi:hypothetical protein
METSQELQVVDSSVLSTIIDAEVDRQVATAKKYPRNLETIKKNVHVMTCSDKTTAEQMFFKLPRDGKTIEGESIRLAEIVLGEWGNIRFGQRITAITHDTVTAQAVVWDLERNTSINVEETRSILNKEGRRYTQDMVIMTGRAAMSIALRNATFRAIPKAFFAGIIEEIKKVAIGSGTNVPLEKRVADEFAYFGKLGVKPENVLEVLERKNIKEVTEDDLVVLVGLKTAIREKETTVQEVFHTTPAAQQRAKTEEVHTKMGGYAAKHR